MTTILAASVLVLIRQQLTNKKNVHSLTRYELLCRAHCCTRSSSIREATQLDSSVVPTHHRGQVNFCLRARKCFSMLHRRGACVRLQGGSTDVCQTKHKSLSTQLCRKACARSSCIGVKFQCGRAQPVCIHAESNLLSTHHLPTLRPARRSTQGVASQSFFVF